MTVLADQSAVLMILRQRCDVLFGSCVCCVAADTGYWTQVQERKARVIRFLLGLKDTHHFVLFESLQGLFPFRVEEFLILLLARLVLVPLLQQERPAWNKGASPKSACPPFSIIQVAGGEGLAKFEIHRSTRVTDI